MTNRDAIQTRMTENLAKIQPKLNVEEPLIAFSDIMSEIAPDLDDLRRRLAKGLVSVKQDLSGNIPLVSTIARLENIGYRHNDMRDLIAVVCAGLEDRSVQINREQFYSEKLVKSLLAQRLVDMAFDGNVPSFNSHHMLVNMWSRETHHLKMANYLVEEVSPAREYDMRSWDADQEFGPAEADSFLVVGFENTTDLGQKIIHTIHDTAFKNGRGCDLNHGIGREQYANAVLKETGIHAFMVTQDAWVMLEPQNNGNIEIFVGEKPDDMEGVPTNGAFFAGPKSAFIKIAQGLDITEEAFEGWLSEASGRDELLRAELAEGYRMRKTINDDILIHHDNDCYRVLAAGTDRLPAVGNLEQDTTQPRKEELSQ